MVDHEPGLSSPLPSTRLPSDRLPFSRLLWFGAFVALLTQPWCRTTGCNGGTRELTGIDLMPKHGLVFPVFLFAFAMLAPVIASFAGSTNLRKAVEALSFTAALVTVPLVALIPRFEVLGQRVALFAADAGLAVALLGLVDAFVRIVANAKHREAPAIGEPISVLPPPSIAPAPIRVEGPTGVSRAPSSPD